jgi:nitrogen fixation-related uncharacterized protein
VKFDLDQTARCELMADGTRTARREPTNEPSSIPEMDVKRRSRFSGILRSDGISLLDRGRWLVGLLGFLWSLKSGQYDDLEGAAWRAIADDEPAREKPAA